MRGHASALTLTEVIVVIIIVGILVIPLVDGFFCHRATEIARQRACASNLKQIAVACATYADPYGDFWPCHWDGNTIYGEEIFRDTDGDGCGDMLRTGKTEDPRDGRTFEQALKSRDPWNNPMQSLALLYPGFIDDERIFKCPSTKDVPKIAILDVRGSRHNAFGKDTATQYKCGYFYDPLTHFRHVGPGQAVCADADGFAWQLPNGDSPAYPDNWNRVPRKSNHPGGQNVMYFDGRVKWSDNNYTSDDPRDNIFVPNGLVGNAATPGDLSWLLHDALWGQDTDAWLWDESSIGVWQWEG